VLTLALLALFGLVGGIGISAVGPGGVLPTIGLFGLTALSPAGVAGTALVTHVATGALGCAAYLRSGELRRGPTRRTALALAGTAALGTPVGARLNALVPHRVFGYLLVAMVLLVLALMWWRARGGHREGQPRLGAVLAVGLGTAVAAGVVGIGGPMLSVPLLVGLGVPMLEALAAAQAQSVLVASTGTLSYLAAGAVNWPLAALVGVPELVGVLLGWRIAQLVPERRLKIALVGTLLVLTPWLALASPAGS
jgi:uncharacterized protein